MLKLGRNLRPFWPISSGRKRIIDSLTELVIDACTPAAVIDEEIVEGDIQVHHAIPVHEDDVLGRKTVSVTKTQENQNIYLLLCIDGSSIKSRVV